ncbi:reverse transcriptase domain containing protein [Babesia ovata]|uniref:Reverse transcriptase domain containing protein n=1 Tax=Babesia ovata TaxID=189622 RepID=A0A2H6KD02_9APIC|nr:reverse transcriptase domain containing protein [Babesia ovata]GBE60873.1 reverse transcriptase domain containing protein [Babesia ovata]
MGTRSNVQGAKEHALSNIALNEKHNGQLRAVWIDVMKAYDSIDHDYLAQVIENLHLPGWLSLFIKQTVKKWNIEIRWHNNTLMHKKVERGILQGDSLSPLLFVLCLDPLSRHLTRLFPKVEIQVPGDRVYATNHFLYIDDLKIFAHEESTIIGMTREVELFFKNTGFVINRDKSATNTEACSSIAKMMEGPDTYRYLGVTENRHSITECNAVYETIVNEICRRVELLATSKLSAKNLSLAINEYALSVINYYVGVIPMDITYFNRIDLEVRTRIADTKAHAKWANTQRLYLPRKEMGRGLHSMVFRAEAMLLRLWMTFAADEATSERRAAIMQHYRETYAHISLLLLHLEGRYGLKFEQEDTIEKCLRDLRRAQNKWLYDRMEVKSTHKVLFAKRDDPNLDIEGSSLVFTSGILSPSEEAQAAAVQDRNLTWMSPTKKCPRCKNGKNVDHLATKCPKMLRIEYTRRHEAVARIIHSELGRQIGLPKEKMDAHKIESEVHGKHGWIAYDKTVKTQKIKEYNRPDIIVADRRRNMITIVEIGITNQDNLVETEIFKKRKYEALIEDLKARQFNQHTTFRAIPYVMTWEGIVTNKHTKYRRDLGISDRLEAHIQRVVIQETQKLVLRDMKPREDYDSVNDPLAQTGWMPQWMVPVTFGNMTLKEQYVSIDRRS